MCITYTCHGCRNLKNIYCRYADWNQVNPNCHLPTYDPHRHTRHRKCHDCITIEGAIKVLRTLIFQQPWLETEGLSGAENRPAWEIQDLKHKSKNAWDFSYAQEDYELMKRLKSMQLDRLDGKDALNDGHGIDPAVDSGESIDIATEKEEDSISEPVASVWGSDEETWGCGSDATDENVGKQGSGNTGGKDDALSCIGTVFDGTATLG